MSYKFYKSTTTRNFGLEKGVSVAFELTINNRNNVYILTDLYASSYKFPINLGLIKRIGDSINNGYGEGTNLNVLFKLNTELINSENKLTLTHPHMEDEDFIFDTMVNDDTEKYMSKTSDSYIIVTQKEATYITKEKNVIFELPIVEDDEESSKFEGTIRNKKIVFKQNGSYELTLTYDSDERLLFVENDAEEKEIVEFIYTNSLLTYIIAYKNKTLLEKILLTYGGNTLYGVKKSLYGSTSYQYNVSHTIDEDDEENQYLEYVDNIKGTSTKLYLSGGTIGFVNRIEYPANTISISYSNFRTRIYNDTTYIDVFYSKDGTLLCIKNSEGFIETYSYKETSYLLDYKKLLVESSSLFEDASKNGDIIEGKLKGVLYSESSSGVACPSGRSARILTFNEYDTSTEDGIDYFTFDCKGGRLDVFSALVYAKVKSIPSTLSSIKVGFMLKFKNKAGEILSSTVLNEAVVNIADTTNWYEQLIIGQAPSTFESVELEVFNTSSCGEELYFDVVLYKGNLGTSYMYDVNGNVVRLLKGLDLTGLKISSNNKLESTSHVVCSYDEIGRIMQAVDINNTISTLTYDDKSNVTKKTSTYKNGFVEEDISTYDKGEYLTKEIKDGIETTFTYDDKRRRIGSSNIIQGVEIKDIIRFIDGNNVNNGKVIRIDFDRYDTYKFNGIDYDNKNNICTYVDGGNINRLYEFTYDSLNRITSIKYDGKTLVSYSYDSKGNISSYHYSDDTKVIRNVYNYVENNSNIPYGSITSICLDHYDEEEDYTETLYTMTYNNKKLKSTLNQRTNLKDEYVYDFDKIKKIRKKAGNSTLFELETKHNHFDQVDETHTKVGNYTYINKVSNSSNVVNKNVIGLDYVLSSKDDSSLYWTFFAPRVTTSGGVKKEISCDLLNKETPISLESENVSLNYLNDGLRFMSVPYSVKGLVYSLGFTTNCSLLIDLDIPTGNGELFRTNIDHEKYISLTKENGKTIISLYSSTALWIRKTINEDLLGHHVLSLNYYLGLLNSSLAHCVDFYVDGVKKDSLISTSTIYLNQITLNGFNSSTNNKYGAIIVRKNKVFTDKELKDYIKRINEVCESKEEELKPSNIAYNEIKYKYDEIIFNNTFESRNGIKPIRQINDDSFYSIKENFEYVPSLRGEGIGDNVYAIKGQELVYDLGLSESGTIAIRGKTLLDKDVTLLQLVNDDLNIKIEKNASNNLRLLVNNVLKSTVSDLDIGFKNIVVTWSKVIASSSLESTTYNINVYKDDECILTSSIITNSDTSSLMKVYLGKGKDEEVEEELLGYIDKLVYTDIVCDEEEVSSICTHLNHNEYCYNKLDCASRLESKTINTSSNKVIKKDYTYNNSTSSLSRVPSKEVLSINGVTKETRSYTYDYLKRVKTMYVGSTLTTYKYDNKGYLTKLVDGTTTYNYSYDDLGNITNNNGLALQYDGQLLRKYGSTVVNYNGMYPINEVVNGVVTKTYDWLGSKLLGVISNKSYLFSYNARGLRERKLIKVSTLTEQEIYYFYDLNDRLIAETRYQYTTTGLKTKMCDIIYMYDATGLLYGFRYNNVDYYYDRDILGNINHIILANGQVVVTYKYDAYGSHKVYNSSGVEVLDSSFIGNINPFRYKGYYYDVETQLFYCNSRYYSPELCRWISPDSIEYLDPSSINGLNLYCYCENNPVMYSDGSGHFPILAVLIGAGIGFLTSYIPDVISEMQDGFDWSDFNTFEDNWVKYVGATLGGAIGGLGAGLGTTILANGVGNVVEAAFAGDISNFGDVMIQFALGGVLGGVGYGASKGIASIFADKKIFGILGNLSDNAKVNKRLAKAGFGNLKIGKHGLATVYEKMYKKLGFETLEKGLSYGYDTIVGFIF